MSDSSRIQIYIINNGVVLCEQDQTARERSDHVRLLNKIVRIDKRSLENSYADNGVSSLLGEEYGNA